ncbi:MAG: ATP-binding cassette domain-containing protein [Cyclobacteriaceae bacterium]|nr:ATP-binding cassette domain-containing protein [Cyclobacteriaceae bacterium]
MAVAIRSEHLSKAYQIGEFGTGTLSRDLERWWAGVRGKEDPFLKIGAENDRTQAGTGNVVWSLRDLTFDIQQGDAVAIIGKNGAGKSTLLKILSRVTSPTRGDVWLKGRVASLLEVGTGFHPELTGRENVFLNGSILGMRKAEISRQFDAIVDFAGVERYIDTPVKRYSSGMYVRLAFAVAAHLESEILIVDEVLAVGDAEFQKKCLGKMNEVSRGAGRTVLFVSHNIGAVRQLCTKGILLRNGRLSTQGDIEHVVSAYTKSDAAVSQIRSARFDGALASKLAFQKLLINQQDADAVQVTASPSREIEVTVQALLSEAMSVRLGLSFYKEGLRVFTIHDVAVPTHAAAGPLTSVFRIPSYVLRPGMYSIALGAYQDTNHGEWSWGMDLTTVEVLEEWDAQFENRAYGLINLPHLSYRK